MKLFCCNISLAFKEMVMFKTSPCIQNLISVRNGSKGSMKTFHQRIKQSLNVYKKADVQSRPENYRSSHPRCSIGKGVLKNFAKFTGKHLFQSLFLIKLQA